MYVEFVSIDSKCDSHRCAPIFVNTLSPDQLNGYRSRFNSAPLKEHYDYTKDFFENVALSLIYGKSLKGQYLTADEAMNIFERLCQTFTFDELCRKFPNSANTVEYFEHIYRFEQFWLRFYDQREHFNIDSTLFGEYGVPSLFTNKFVDIFNNDLTLNQSHVLRAPILNCLSNATYVSQCQNDIQIVQLNLDDYLLIVVKPQSIEIHGMLSIEDFNKLAITDTLLKRYPNRYPIGSNPANIYQSIAPDFCIVPKASGIVCCAYAIDFVRHGHILERDPINILELGNWFIDIWVVM